MLVLLVKVVMLALVLLALGQLVMLLVAVVHFDVVEVYQVLKRKCTKRFPLLNRSVRGVIWRRVEHAYHYFFDLMLLRYLLLVQLGWHLTHEL